MYINKVGNQTMTTYIIKLSNNTDNKVEFVQRRSIDGVYNFIISLIKKHKRDKDCTIDAIENTKFDCKIVHPESDIAVYVRVYEYHTLR